MEYPVDEIQDMDRQFPAMGAHRIAPRFGLTMAEVHEILQHGNVLRETQEWAEDFRRRMRDGS